MSDIEKHNVEQEQIVLAVLMTQKPIRRKMIRQLDIGDFVGERHKIIFKAIRKLCQNGLSLNIATIKSHINKPDEDWGGAKYLRTIQQAFGDNENPMFHLGKMKRNTTIYKLRTETIPDLMNSLADDDLSLGEITEKIDSIKLEVVASAAKVPLTSNADIQNAYIEDSKERVMNPQFVGTGFENIDKHLTSGLAKGKVTIFGGRPRNGKTTAMLNIILKNLNLRQLIVPIEVGAVTCIDTMVSILTEIPLEKLVKYAKDLTTKEKIAKKKALETIFANDKIKFLDHYFNKSPKKISTGLITEIVDSHQFDIVYIDLFDRLADVSQDPSILFKKLQYMQGLVQERQFHGFFTAQINRAVEKEKDKRPTLASLKASGAFEEVADLVIGVHREKVYNPLLTDDIMEWLILKQKLGKQENVAFHYHPAIFKIGDPVDNANEYTFDITKMLVPAEIQS